MSNSHYTPDTEETPPPKDKLIALLDEWMADDSGYDEENLPEIKEAVDRNRPEYRKIFEGV